jgi:hypothetical protein
VGRDPRHRGEEALMATTIGTLNLELTANTAQFQREMGKTRETLDKTEKSFGATQRGATNFATKGLGSIAPDAAGAEKAIGKVIDKLLAMGGAAKVAGQGLIVIGTFLAAREAGQKIREEIDNWLAFGETVDVTMERLKREATEQEKFAQQRVRAIQLILGFEQQLAVQTLQAAAQRAKFQGEETQVSLALTVQAEQAALAARTELQRRQIIESVQNEALRARALAGLLAASTAERLAIEEKYLASSAKLSQDKLEKERAAFQKTTEFWVDEYKKRFEARKKLDEDLAKLVEAGRIQDPLADTRAITKSFNEEAKALATLTESGVPWRDVQGQIFEKVKEFQDKGVPGFAQAVEDYRKQMIAAGTDTAALTKTQEILNKNLGVDMPANIDKADPAIQKLIERFKDIQREAGNAATAVQTLANVISIQRNAPPIVTAPVGQAVPSPGTGIE